MANIQSAVTGSIVGIIVGAAISFIIFFYLIRGAVKSAMKDVLGRYDDSIKYVLRCLGDIRGDPTESNDEETDGEKSADEGDA